jgi:TPR repeat protein
MVLRRAANAGNAQAALALGGTYDGMLLAELGVLGFAADPAQARVWYQRALELGSREASRRLDRLAGVER